VDIGSDDPEWTAVEEEMQSTIRYKSKYFTSTTYWVVLNQGNSRKICSSIHASHLFTLFRKHWDQGHAGGLFSSYRVYKIQKIRNTKLWER